MAEQQPTIFGLIERHGRTPADEILGFAQLAAAAERVRLGDPVRLSRSTALWAILRLDRGLEQAVAPNGITEPGLARSLGLVSSISPDLEATDVALLEDLRRALETAFTRSGAPPRVGLVDLAYAILSDVEKHGGALGGRLDGADLEGAVIGLTTLLDKPPGPPAHPREVSEAAELYVGYYEALRGLTKGPAGIDEWAIWAAFERVAVSRPNTLATVVARVVPAQALRAGDGVAPLPLDPADVAGHALVVLAGAVRDRVEPGEIVHLRHLVAVAIEQPSAGLVGERDVAAVRDAFLAQIRVDAPAEVAARWAAYFAAAAPAAVGRAVAGVDVDLVDDSTRLDDELGVVDDVVVLCDMLAAKGSVAPISVGLFGRWGSGKSYFMALMRRRIEELRQAADEARERGEETSYCPDIVQVTFNAWHYMDADDLWATLAVHLFNAIGRADPDDDHARTRADVVSELLERKQDMATVDRKITRALRDPRLDAAAERTGLASTRAEALGLLTELDATVGYAAALKVAWSKGWRRVALLVGAGTLVVLAALVVRGTIPAGWLLALGAAVGTGSVWLGRIKSVLAQVNQVAADAGLKPRDLTQERIDDDSRVVELMAELEAIDRLAGIRDWVRERALSADYTSHFGVISVLRGDLEALVDRQRRDAPDRRIVLYIDDLDRCEPARVVEVLQAVHLLLAFPLFVAVVGVDPRWLLQSLERHYRQILSTDDGELLTESTPHDYLEKIFQIPFALRSMGTEGYGKLVASLIGEPALSRRRQRSPDAVEEDVAVPEGPGDEPPPPAEAPDPAPAEAEVERPATPAAPAAPPPPERPRIVANPPQLRITQDEVDALAEVGSLIGTPRAAKRLVNLYRLVRAGLDDAAVDRFVAERQYRALAVVLAAQVGWPRIATACLTELAQGRDEPADVDQDTATLRAALAAFDVPASELARWIPRLRRYSFEGALS